MFRKDQAEKEPVHQERNNNSKSIISPHMTVKWKNVVDPTYEVMFHIPQTQRIHVFAIQSPIFVPLKRVSRQMYPFRSYRVVAQNHPKLFFAIMRRNGHLKKSIIKSKGYEAETPIRPSRIAEGYLFVCFVSRKR